MSKKQPFSIDVKQIKNPSFLKGLSYADLNVVCQAIRGELIHEVSLSGGHLSANLGDVEATVALHRVFDFPTDKLIFDVGHQCYTHKILTGRNIDAVGHTGHVSGFQNRKESEFDPYDAGHSSTAISAAEAFAISRDDAGENYNVIAFVGDSSIVNGLSMEALNHLSTIHHKVIIVLNDNGMSISKPVGGLGAFFRKIGTGKTYNRLKASYNNRYRIGKMARGWYSFSYRAKQWLKNHLIRTNIFDDLGFSYIGAVDGHDLKAVEKALARAKNTTKSVVVHLITQKGKGYEPAEKDDDGSWHYAGPFDPATGATRVNRGATFTGLFAALASETLEKDPSAVLITPATLKGSELDEAFSKFPKQCYDVGIAEEHALTFAGALALSGKHPIVSIYSTFLQRAYDEASHDVARMNANVTLLVDRCGFSGSNGETHQGLYDVAFLRSIPGCVVTMPSTAKQARELLAMGQEGHGLFAIRYARETLNEEETPDLAFGRFCFLKEGSKKAVVAPGPKGRELLHDLSESDYDLIDPVFLNPIAEEDARKLAQYDEVVIYDTYGTKEGFASNVSLSLMEHGFQGNLKVFAAKTAFIPYGSVEEQQKDSGVDKASVLEKLL